MVSSDTTFMMLALTQARVAMASGEVPVGAVVVKAGQVIAVGRNAPIGDHDPTAHAEIVALRAAAQVLGNYRLDDCELFVTLEPCAMCAGAMMHARLKRVVFGASDPKTGAAGSVLDLFAIHQLNHQTQIRGGLIASECRGLLQDFFQQKRVQNRTNATPVRDDALRTPDSYFNLLAGYPWQAHYVNDLPTLAGLRLHFLDQGPVDAPLVYLCLHGPTTWSYIFKDMIEALSASGNRIVAPDLIGFGKSDKPKKESFHQFDWHCTVLQELLEQLDLNNVVLVIQDDIKPLGLALQRAASSRFKELGARSIHAASDEVLDKAPFPDRGHRAGPRALPLVLYRQLTSAFY